MGFFPLIFYSVCVNWINGVAVITWACPMPSRVQTKAGSSPNSFSFSLYTPSQSIYLSHTKPRLFAYHPRPRLFNILYSQFYTFFYFPSLSLSLSLPSSSFFTYPIGGKVLWTETLDVISLWQFDWIGLWVCDRVWEPLRSILPFPFVFLGCSRRILKIGFLIWGYGLFSLFRFEGRGEAESRKGKRWW